MLQECEFFGDEDFLLWIKRFVFCCEGGDLNPGDAMEDVFILHNPSGLLAGQASSKKFLFSELRSLHSFREFSSSEGFSPGIQVTSMLDNPKYLQNRAEILDDESFTVTN